MIRPPPRSPLFPSPPLSRSRLMGEGQGLVWSADSPRGKRGRLDPATGKVRDFPSPGGDGSEPYGIAVGTDGRVWYDESGTDQMVAFDPATEHAETVKIPTAGSGVRNIAVDSTRARRWL